MFTALQSVENTAGEVNSTAKTLSLSMGMRHRQNNNSSFCVTAAPHEPKTGNDPVSIALLLARCCIWKGRAKRWNSIKINLKNSTPTWGGFWLMRQKSKCWSWEIEMRLLNKTLNRCWRVALNAANSRWTERTITARLSGCTSCRPLSTFPTSQADCCHGDQKWRAYYRSRGTSYDCGDNHRPLWFV